MCVLSAHMCTPHACAWSPWKSEGIGSPKDGCKSRCGFLQEQQVLLITETSSNL